jgi:hypothetical protein
MTIIQTFLFETAFYEKIRHKNYHLFTKKIVRYALN